MNLSDADVQALAREASERLVRGFVQELQYLLDSNPDKPITFY